MKTFTPPNWLKTSPFVYHVPERVIFSPQRRITFRNSVPCLVDELEQTYPLAQCEPLRLEHLTGTASLITENQTLTVYRDRTIDCLIVTDGKRKKGIILPRPKPVDKVLQAAQSFAKAFDGVIVSGVNE